VGLGVFQGLCTKKEHLRQVRAVIAASRYRHHRHRQPCEIYVCLIGADVEVSPWSMAAVIMMVDFRGSLGRCEKNIWFSIVRCGAVHFFIGVICSACSLPSLRSLSTSCTTILFAHYSMSHHILEPFRNRPCLSLHGSHLTVLRLCTHTHTVSPYPLLPTSTHRNNKK
jgi:hypothetical protein